MPFQHTPVLLHETIECLGLKPGQIIVDGTLGGCGHARAILKQILPGGMLIGVDQDMDAINNAEALFPDYRHNVRLVNGNYAELPQILLEQSIPRVDAILVDLGVSTHQLQTARRGFSFHHEGPLDMRMNNQTGITAAEIVNEWPTSELKRIFTEYGEERWANKIAKHIDQIRRKEPIKTTLALSNIICDAIPKKWAATSKIHPATKVFMALRIAVNQELANLRELMRFFIDILSPKGRMAVIAFHSLEDRIVKNQFKALAKSCQCPPDFPVCICNGFAKIKLITPKPIRPKPDEIAGNPLARSAKLRAAEKL